MLTETANANLPHMLGVVRVQELEVSVGGMYDIASIAGGGDTRAHDLSSFTQHGLAATPFRLSPNTPIASSGSHDK